MARQLRLLDQARIAAPCPASWDDMKGDDRVRHCSLCRLNVYNLSDMTDREAESLLQERLGQRLCVRYYLRPDGKVMTKDCPRGVKALRQKAVRQFAIAASFVLTAIGCGDSGEKIKQAYGLDKFEKKAPPVALAGAIACPPPTPTPPPTVKGGKTAPVPIPLISGKSEKSL